MIALGDCFDAAIGEVAHHAGQPFPSRPVLGEIPEPDALHSAAHQVSASYAHPGYCKPRNPGAQTAPAGHGDGWLPLTFDLEQTVKDIKDIHAQMRELGRDPARLEVSLFFLGDAPSDEVFARVLETGVKRIILKLPVMDESTVLKTLDGFAQFVG